VNDSESMREADVPSVVVDVNSGATESLANWANATQPPSNTYPVPITGRRTIDRPKGPGYLEVRAMARARARKVLQSE